MFRSITESDVETISSCVRVDPTGFIGAERYRRELADRQFRLEWTWVYEERGRLRGRALWWGQADHAHPRSLDCLWMDPSVPRPERVAQELIKTAHARLREAGMQQLPDFNINVETGWRSDPAARHGVAWRREAAAKAGLPHFVERLSYAFTRQAALPSRTSRLVFRPADDDAILGAFRRVAEGSLDILTQRNLHALGSDGQARDDLDFYRGLPGRRDWWRLAFTPAEVLIGLIIPSRTAYGPSVSYLGVVPEARGAGYVDDLLAEVTHLHVNAGATRITATTDTTNRPMADAFERASYALESVRIVLSASPP